MKNRIYKYIFHEFIRNFIVYEKDHTEITFHVSADGSGRLGHIVKGKIYTVSIEDGRWILRR